MDRGAWQVTVHGVSKSLTQLSHQIALAGSQSCPLWGTSHQSLFAYKASLKKKDAPKERMLLENLLNYSIISLINNQEIVMLIPFDLISKDHPVSLKNYLNCP